MTPVTQSKIVSRDGYGTCLSACFASLLDLPESAVPHFSNRTRFADGGSTDFVEIAFGREKANWWLAIHAWSAFMGYEFDVSRDVSEWDDPYIIAIGKSPRSTDDNYISHAVIFGRQPDGTYTLVHDPYPDGEGLIGEPESYYRLRKAEFTEVITN